MPEKIEVESEFTEGFTGWEGEKSALLRDGWSYVANSRGGIVPNMVHLYQIQLDNYFDQIDFSQVNNWKIAYNWQENITDTTSYQFYVTLHFEDSSNNNQEVTLSYSGGGDYSLYVCADENACEFVKLIFRVFNDIEKRSITIPNISGFYGICFILLALGIPFLYQMKWSSQQHNYLIQLIESGALMFDFYFWFAILSLFQFWKVLFYPLQFLYLPHFLLAISFELVIFHLYYKKIWFSLEYGDKETIDDSEPKNEVDDDYR